MEIASPRYDIKDLGITALLGLIWVACAVLINPIGDFPLNDDWAYGLPVEVLLRDRAVRFTDWQGASLVAQLFWGALYCLPAGFSFTALRISTVSAGLVGLISMYFLLRHLGGNLRIATLGAVVVAFSPFYLLLSNSFMTDVPFLALMILAMLLMLRGVDLDHGLELALGLILACLSILVRQIGLMLLIGMFFAYPIRRGFGKGWLLVGVLPAILGAGLLRLFERYLDLVGETPGGFTIKSASIKDFWIDLAHGHVGAFKTTLGISLIILMYSGLVALPFLLLIAPRVLARLTPSRPKAGWLLVAGAALGVTGVLTRRYWLMPMSVNQFNDFGLGLISLPGKPAGLPRPFWMAITALAATGSALIILTLGVLGREKWMTRGPAFRHESWPWQVVFLLAVAAFNLAPIAFAYGAFFDRYFLVFVPLGLGLIVVLGRGQDLMPGAPVQWLSASVMAVILGFGVAGTHDYLAWNRARWAAAADLHQRLGIPETEIDGGFEYNNYFDTRERLRARWIHTPGFIHVMEEDPPRPYRLAIEPIESYEIISRIDCGPWLPRAVRQIYALRRPATSTPPPDSAK